jgi:hypothetical protein
VAHFYSYAYKATMKIYKKRTSKNKARKFIRDEKKAQKPVKPKDDHVTTRNMAKMKLSGQKERMEKSRKFLILEIRSEILHSFFRIDYTQKWGKE